MTSATLLQRGHLSSSTPCRTRASSLPQPQRRSPSAVCARSTFLKLVCTVAVSPLAAPLAAEGDEDVAFLRTATAAAARAAPWLGRPLAPDEARERNRGGEPDDDEDDDGFHV